MTDRDIPITRRAMKLTPATRQTGLSLVELLVALTISLILMIGVGRIFLGSSTTYTVNEAQSRLQENVRFAIQFITEDIRMAGYSGCGRAGIKRLTILADPEKVLVPESFLDGVGVSGFDDGWSNPTTITQVGNTDGIVLVGGDGRGLRLDNYNNDSANIPVKGDFSHINQDDLLIITDCNFGDIVAVVNDSQGNAATRRLAISQGRNLDSSQECPGRKSNRLCGEYGADASVMKFGEWSYFIGEDDGRRSLYRAETGGTTEALVENVESMRLRYGIDTDGDRTADVYRAAGGSLDWAEVVSVQVELVVSSDVRLPEPGPANFPVFGDENETHNIQESEPNRLRRLVSTTITLRNRAL